MTKVYPFKRNLDGVLFRVCRNGKWEPVCFSDLTDVERDEVLKDKQPLFLRQLCRELANRLRAIGMEHDISYSRSDCNED